MITRHSHAAFAFIAVLLLHDPIIAMTGVAFLSHALLGLSMFWFFLSLELQILNSHKLSWAGRLPTLVVICLLAGIGIFYSVIDTGSLNVKIQFLATFMLVPAMWAAFSKLAVKPNLHRSLMRLLLFYIAIELVIVFLQITYFLFGIGIPPSEIYESMISGSQFNSNNLAAIVVLLSIFFNASSYDLPGRERILFNLMAVIILLITFSRLALLLYFADRIRALTMRQTGLALALSVILLVGGVTVSSIEYTGNEIIDTGLYKAKSLVTIAQIGLLADSSTSSRSESYLNFIEQIGHLGTGTRKILDYSTFTSSANFDDKALYVNPHSMVVEFGYWMGWSGLLALVLFILVAYTRPSQGNLKQRVFLLCVVIVATSIPSSAIPLPSLWVGLLLLAMMGNFDLAGRSQLLGRTCGHQGKLQIL